MIRRISSSRNGIPRAWASCRATQGQMYTSPTIRPAGSVNAKVSTSVGRSCPLCWAFSRRMESRPRKVTEIRASWRSRRSTVWTTRCTSERETGKRRPLTATSLTLGRLEFRGDTATGAGIADPLVVGARHDSGELALDPIQITQGQRGIVQLARAHFLLNQMLDGAAHRFGCRAAQHPHGGFGRIGQHGYRRLGGLRARSRIAEVGRIDPAVRIVASSPAQEVGDVRRSMVFRNKGLHYLGQRGGLSQSQPIEYVTPNESGRLQRGHLVMGIGRGALVLHEVPRVGQFAD